MQSLGICALLPPHFPGTKAGMGPTEKECKEETQQQQQEMPPGLPRGHREEKDKELGMLCRELGTQERLQPFTLPAAS